jgi:basic membrane protein A and related proteins
MLVPLKGASIVYLINGSLGDHGFYDSGETGLKKIAQDFGAQVRTIEADFDHSKFAESVTTAFKSGDVVFAVAFGFEDLLLSAAAKNPDIPVVSFDLNIDDRLHNVTSVEFADEETAFFAGATAALATTEPSISGMNPEKKLGVVQLDADPITSAISSSFANGAHFIDPSIEILIESLGGAFDDIENAKTAADSLFDRQVDTIFNVAGNAAGGVLEAAKRRNRFAIGFDSNQNDLAPTRVIGSATKDLGVAMTIVAKSLNEGTFESGITERLGFSTKSVAFTFAPLPTLSDATRNRLEQLRADLERGLVILDPTRSAPPTPTIQTTATTQTS